MGDKMEKAVCVYCRKEFNPTKRQVIAKSRGLNVFCHPRCYRNYWIENRTRRRRSMRYLVKYNEMIDKVLGEIYLPEHTKFRIKTRTFHFMKRVQLQKPIKEVIRVLLKLASEYEGIAIHIGRLNYRILQKYRSVLNIEPIQNLDKFIESGIKMIAYKRRWDKKDVNRVLRICQSISYKVDGKIGGTPHVNAAAIIYMSVIFSGLRKIPQWELAEIFHTTDMSIRRAIKDVVREAGLDHLLLA